MKITTLLLPTLLLVGVSSAYSPPEVLSLSVVDDDFETLNSSYDAAVSKWNKAIHAASGDERSKLMASQPVFEFWPRYDALSQKGDGQAKLWLAANMNVARVVAVKDRKEVLHGLYKDLVTKHRNSDWFGPALLELGGSTRALGEDLVLELLQVVIEESTSKENRAGALYNAAQVMLKSDDESVREWGVGYMDRVESEFSDTSWLRYVKDFRAKQAVAVGRMAPNFQGKTHDGFEFELKEYKGKVVLLDFYGFW